MLQLDCHCPRKQHALEIHAHARCAGFALSSLHQVHQARQTVSNMASRPCPGNARPGLAWWAPFSSWACPPVKPPSTTNIVTQIGADQRAIRQQKRGGGSGLSEETENMVSWQCTPQVHRSEDKMMERTVQRMASSLSPDWSRRRIILHAQAPCCPVRSVEASRGNGTSNEELQCNAIPRSYGQFAPEQVEADTCPQPVVTDDITAA